MGRRGPKPKTTEQLRIMGSHTPKKRDGRAVASKVSCPRGLSFSAKKIWKAAVEPLAKQGLVSGLDVSALARYCRLSALLEDAEAKIDKQGAVILYTNGNEGKSPWVTIAMETSRLLIQLEKELGLTPYARKGIVPAKDMDAEEPAAKYFG